MELAQDLKSIHGLDAESELSNILSTEILAEINREVVRSIYTVAKRVQREQLILASLTWTQIPTEDGRLRSLKVWSSKLSEI